jgi:hypothetical protein
MTKKLFFKKKVSHVLLYYKNSEQMVLTKKKKSPKRFPASKCEVPNCALVLRKRPRASPELEPTVTGINELWVAYRAGWWGPGGQRGSHGQIGP